MVLYNPLDQLGEYAEDFITHYMGKGIKIRAGEKIKFPDPAAKHILTEFSPRGLVVLDYDDAGNEEKRAKEGIEKNREFKLRQLNVFNETNEARKHTGLPYLWPKDHIKKYAKEFGLKLTESYRVDDTHLAREKTLMDENAQLRKQFKELMDMMAGKFEMKVPIQAVNIDTGNPNNEVAPVNESAPLNKDGSPDKRFKNKDPGG